VLRKELQEAHAIMYLCRMKLSQYHALLQRSFVPTASAEVLQVLEGLREVSHLYMACHVSVSVFSVAHKVIRERNIVSSS
jgi:predicted component of viral defense system (DUF524 family)